jgi:alpha-tubulin suppressor-like RCC1 family protein
MTAPCSSYLTGVTKIYPAGNTTFAQRQDGSVVAWGDNSYGQLGNGTECGGDPANVGNTECSGPSPASTYTSPVEVSQLDGVTQIAGGSWHALALEPDGTVVGWGYNASGQIGNGSYCVDGGSPSCYVNTAPAAIPGLTKVTDIAGGGFFSAAVRSDGTLWMWGDNSYGQLGRVTCPLDNNDDAYDAPQCWAAGDGTPTQVPGVSNVTAVYLQTATTIAISKDVNQSS